MAINDDQARDGVQDPADLKKQHRRDLRQARRALRADPAGSERAQAEGPALIRQAEPLLSGLRQLLVERAAAGRGPGDAPGAPLVRVAVFRPSPAEPDAMGLIRELAALGSDGQVELLFPAASGGPELNWVPWDGTAEFSASAGKGFGAEPDGTPRGPEAIAQVDLVIAPALAVDRSGTRLGHGGGYYDRALRRRSEGVPVVAVVHPMELLESGALIREAHDEPVDAVLTTVGLYRCDGGMLTGDRAAWLR